MKSAIFTICAKNYLAQALTLRNSAVKYNSEIDFFIFLSDLSEPDAVFSEVIELDESWIEDWKRMAFKYNVIEFSTSIKPFCIRKLFDDGYDHVIYLDPDIYVTGGLDPIFNLLDDKSVVLTPHYCNIQTEYTGAVPEEELLFVGIYNLGFIAIKNDDIGSNVISWWCSRLRNKCYADHHDALHVDQRWMDFIPGFFPRNVCISHHFGINPAIWNLHERELVIDKRLAYQIKNSYTEEVFPLLFFHFSGFDPFNKSVLNRRHPKYSIKQFPSFEPLINEYVAELYKHDYEKLSRLKYSFNTFETNDTILPIHRRIFRNDETLYLEPNPFSRESKIYLDLKSNGLLSSIQGGSLNYFSGEERERKGKLIMLLKWGLKQLKRLVGIRYYSSLLSNLGVLVRLENQSFLIKRHDR